VTYGERVNPPSGQPSRRRSLAARVISLAAIVALVSAIPAGASATPVRSAAAVLSTDAALPPELAPYYAQTLAWSPCVDGDGCAWLTVPLDYAQPAGATIRLRISRTVATGPAAQRQGSLVVNPGGPGASGTGFAAYIASAVAPKVATQFDIVGFDTRGVEKSAPITCLTGVQTTRWLRADASPDMRPERARLMSLTRRLAQGCLTMSPEVARHVGTENTVRDLDILRQALGDSKLNWLGFSYGTYVGTLYAEQFPDTVGRFVLDGALDPSLDIMEVSRGQSEGFQVAVTRFAADCSTHRNCPWPGGKGAVLTGLNRLLAQLDRRPLPNREGRDLVQAEALSAIFFSMYSPPVWPSLRLALLQARRGDGTGLQSMADYAAERTGPNTYANNMASAFPAISCWDAPAAPGAAGLRAAAQAWSRGARVPDMAKAMAWGNAACSQWYGHTTAAPAPASSTTSAPILVVGTTFDPATPYPWAVALSKQLTTSTLLTYRGDGHTAFGSGSRCINDAVSSYLLTGALPPVGTVCR
jgi:pimeloyl-ACP methyl ester carboxylesterase